MVIKVILLVCFLFHWQLKEQRNHESESAQDNVSENTALNKLTEEVQGHIQS